MLDEKSSRYNCVDINNTKFHARLVDNENRNGRDHDCHSYARDVTQDLFCKILLHFLPSLISTLFDDDRSDQRKSEIDGRQIAVVTKPHLQLLPQPACQRHSIGSFEDCSGVQSIMR